MTIAYYITSHGFGHFVRSAAVIKALSAEIPLAVRTDIAEWFLNQELEGRPYTLDAGGFDCGTFGRDATHVDIRLSFDRATELDREIQVRLESEAAFLRSHGVRLVVTDMPSFPLKVAHSIGVPSICITNFTWVEIYEALADRAASEGSVELAAKGRALVSHLRADYALGDVLLIPGMALEMGACQRQIEVPIIARTGQYKRNLLCSKLGFDPAKPLYLIYLGQEGYEGLDWSRLRAMKDAQFFSFKQMAGAEDIVRVIPKDLMEHSDASASADVVVGKLGYSLCAECAATRTPLVFPPRPDFIEAVALGGAMMDMGLGVPIDAESFGSGNWAPFIERAHALKKTAQQVDCTGAQICAEILAMAWREGSLENLVSVRAAV